MTNLTLPGKLAAFAIKHARLAFLAMFVILVYGLAVVYPDLPRQSYPDIEQPQGFVTVLYPGATPSEVENLVVKKLEDKIGGISEVEDIESASQEGLARVSVKFEVGSNVDDMIQKLRDKVDEAKLDFPEDVKEPVINSLNFGEQPILTLAIASSANRSPDELKKFAETVQDELENITGVSEVGITGVRVRELRVEFDPLRLSGYGISSQQVIGAIRTSNLNLPGGELTIGDNKYLVRVVEELTTAEDIENVIISVGGSSTGSGQVKQIFLRDVATVVDDFAEQSFITRVMSRLRLPANSFGEQVRLAQHSDKFVGGEAIMLSVKKKLNTNIIQIAADVQKVIWDMKTKLPKDIEFIIIQNDAEQIDEDLTNMQRSALQGLALVMLVLFLFINLRSAIIAGLSIPLSLGIAFIAMKITGATINFVSLFALVIAIGILVDNAIVVVENTHRHISLGKRPKKAAIMAVSEVGTPVISATLTTLAAFLPMAMMSGLFGEFVRILPITIMFALSGSLLVALIFTPVLGAYFSEDCTREARQSGRLGQIFGTLWTPLGAFVKYFRWILKFLAEKYKPFIIWLMGSTRRKLITVTLAWSFFGLSLYLPLSGILPASMFPKEDVGMLVINTELPKGTRIEETNKAIKQIEKIIQQIPELTKYSVTVGSNFTADNSSGSGHHLGSVMLIFPIASERERSTFPIATELRAKLSQLPGMKIEVWEPAGGPPTSKPINIRILGEDLATLRGIARELGGILKKVPGSIDVDDGTSPGTNEIIISIDRQRSAHLGLTVRDIATQVRTAFSGSTAATLRTGETDVDIVVQAPRSSRDQIADLTQIHLTNNRGDQIPFLSVAQIELRPGADTINRFNGSRVITVSGDVREGLVAATVLKDFQQTLTAQETSGEFRLLPGYKIEYAGENEDTAESVRSLGGVMVIGFVLIYLILAAQFNSLTQPFSILTAMPLGLVGVFPGLWLIGLNFTFTSFIGVVALLGIVVNDAIVLFDFIITQHLKKGYPLPQAIAEAGSIRLAPILSTSLTTIGGLLPLTLSQPSWGPLGYSIIFGLSLSTILTLVVIPSMFALVYRYSLFAFLVVFFGIGAGGLTAFFLSGVVGIFAGMVLGVLVALFFAAFIAPILLRGSEWLIKKIRTITGFTFDHHERETDLLFAFAGSVNVSRKRREIGELALLESRTARERENNVPVGQRTQIDKPLFTTDGNGNITYWNHVAEEVSGYKSSEVIGQSFTRLVPPEDLEQVLEERFRRIEEGLEDPWELTVIRQDGVRLRVTVNFTPFYREGQYIGSVGVVEKVRKL